MFASLLLLLTLGGPSDAVDSTAIRREVVRLEAVAARNPANADSWNQVAIAYRRLARWTGGHEAEAKAWQALGRSLSVDPENEEALSLRGWVQAARHDFEGAVVSAQRAIARQPDNSWNYGVLADALTELGRYPDAVKAVGEMMKRRPGVGAFSRAANLRALHGDREGAVELMKLAVEASTPSDPEGRAWCQVMLGREYQALGKHTEAQALYRHALSTISDYHLALFHLAESQAAAMDYPAALVTARRLQMNSPSVAASALVGELLLAMGRTTEAESAFSEVDRAAASGDPGKAEPRWLARFYADRGRNLDAAIVLVKDELKTHQDVETWDGLAWALHRKGETKEALTASDRAMALGTVSSRLLLHQGLIRLAGGRTEDGRRGIERALALGDLWPSERALAQGALRSLGAAGTETGIQAPNRLPSQTRRPLHP